ncbi:MAG: phosphotransferase [Pseudomonadota bacterium]
MTARDTLFEPFLSGTSWANAALSNLAGDASNRRYLRVLDPQAGPAVLMDAPPEKDEDIRPFVAITQTLLNRGFSAPQIHAQNAEKGLLLLEDLGDDLYSRVATQAGVDEHELYAAATDLLVQLALDPGPWTGVAPYDTSTYLREAQLLTDWYLPGHGVAPSADTQAQFDNLITELCATTHARATTLTLRDYHADNLIWLPGRAGLSRVGLLDYQDALVGVPAYDLVSLLEDARRDVSMELAQAMISQFIDGTGAQAEVFERDYAILGAQRNMKILGIFVRLWLRDGKPNYLGLLDRVWGHLQRDLRHPALADLAKWVEANVPAPNQAQVGGAR